MVADHTEHAVPTEPEVLVDRRGALGHLVLNRPRAINALNAGMVGVISAALTEWAADDSVQAVLLSGAGDRGLCAGGDIVAIFHSVREGRDEAQRFWAAEYELDATISRYPKPYLALMDGLVLGGGVGLSAHGSVRVVTERTQLGMPEVTIGFFPDVGGTYLFARAPGELGTHLALTGGMASGSDAIALGLAELFVPSARLGELTEALAGIATADEVSGVVASFAENPPPSELLAHRDWIDAAYAGDDAVMILERLDASPHPEARAAGATIRTKSPTSVAVTLAAIRRAAMLPSLDAALAQDLRVAEHFTHGVDVLEGIRAQVIDKDRTPHWSPTTLAEVSAAAVAEYFRESRTS